ncbi:MAG: glycosyltransferase family 39 protein [Chloroflexi bacterium]|nr:glycosyltransferase family 39 protein [Chloroflexota bacterium]
MSSLRLFLPLILAILLGFFLRLHNLESVPLRGDEAFSVLYWADLPVGESLTRIAQGEPHTPLVYLVARIWRQFVGGIDSVFALRMLSVLGNLLGVSAMYALGARLSGVRSIGLVAAFLFALHPFEIWHSQEFRNYGYWAGMSATTLWLGLRLIDRGRRADWIFYAAAACFTTLTIYTEPFSLIALACFAIIERRRDPRFLRPLLLLQAGIGMLLVIGFALIQVLPGFATSYPGLVQAFSLTDYFTRFVPVLVLGTTIPFDMSALGCALSLVIALASLILFRSSKRQFRFVALTAVMPLLLLGLVSSHYNLFHPRYVLSAAPAFILALVLGSFGLAAHLRRFFRLRPGALGLLVLSPWFVLALATLQAHFNDPAFRRAPAWDELGRFLKSRVVETDLVIQLSVDPAFGYYYQSPAPEMALPVHSAQPVAEIEMELERLRGRFGSIYVVSREQAGWANAGAVVAWMTDNLQEVLLTDTAGLPVRQYMDWAIRQQFDREVARFGDAVALLGHELAPDPLPTGELLLWITWKPLSRTEQSLKSFVHLYGPVNPATGSALWSQDDQYPQGGRLDSKRWRAGEVYRDVYYLPTGDLADGEYQISVGWYDPAGGARLSLAGGADSYALDSAQFTATARSEP